ncbi:MAG TPA: FtsX-like permease family protein [Chitinophagaceae bacterium]|nr:FtsX-like permease family protein [Chitinophagaceae bacterium]
MIKTYFKIAWRNLKKNKTFSFINIFGLSVGLTCCMLISLYLYHSFSYDKYHKHAERVFQLGTAFVDDGKEKRAANTAGPVGKMMQQDFPEVQATARAMKLWRDDKTLFQVNQGTSQQKSFYETDGFLADSSLFEVLSFFFKEGNPNTALREPKSLVLSEQIAEKLFGKEPALDKFVHVSSSTNGDHDLKVTGVFKAPPAPSHFNAKFIMSFAGGDMNGFANDNPSPVNNNMFFTYLMLKEGSNSNALAAKFPAFVQTHLGEELKAMGKERSYFLTPVKDIHLTGVENNVSPGGNKTSLFVLASIALLTLLIACINFMNLSTSSSAKRAAEVGIRKVLGAERNSLLRQFLGESVLMAFVALAAATVFTFLLLPLFERVAAKNLSVPVADYAVLLLVFLVLALVTGLFAGSYPAFYLSAFKPIKVLKGKFANSLAAVSLRKGLVVFQFVISVALIVASLVIANQMKFLRAKDLGFTKDQQIVIPLRTSTAKELIPSFKSAAASNPTISSVGASMSYPGIFHPQDWSMYKEGENMTSSQKVYINLVDDQFLQTLGMKPIAGRLFSPDFPADTLTRFVVNEEAVKQFGFASAEEAIGKWLAFDWQGEQMQYTIVGVVKNFHFKDLHEKIEPFAFRVHGSAGFNYLLAHVKAGSLDQSLSFLENTWKKLNPNEPFEYSFLDLDFQKNYEAESRQASLINYFTVIAIIISCLGLFGLATFTAEQRTKEIGIRKVLGASVAGLVGLLSKDFLKLVAIAVLIASPVAWYFMNQWLQNFAYRSPIPWQLFVLTSFLAMFIAFVTIAFQAIRAALANPVSNLRTE